MKHTKVGGLASLLLALALTAAAQVPETISYQGRVTASGTNFTGTGQFKFALVSTSTNAARQATATAIVTSGFITAINVTDGGAGYLAAPGVTITDSTGSGAAALATVAGGSVTAITVQNAGSGYSATPTVTVDAPPPSLVADTYWSNDDTSAQGSEPAAAVPVDVADGLFMVMLGDTTLPNMTEAIGAKPFSHADARLRVWFSDGVNPFAALTPDQPLGAVGYAQMAAQVGDQAVDDDALRDGAVTTIKLQNGAVTSAKLATGAVAGSNLADNSVTSAKIVDGAVGTGDLADNSVTTAKIADGTITSADLANNSVSSAKIVDGTIVNADLSASAAIADTKLATIATAGKVANSATTATATAGPNTIVARDASGNFAARDITASSFAGNGAALVSLNAAQLTTGTVPDARLAGTIARTNQVWLLGGNAGTTPGTHYLGTSDGQPLEFKVNHLRALRIEDNGDGSDPDTIPDGAPNLIGGSPVNFVAAGVVGATISGGGATNCNGSASSNSVAASFATIGGGTANTIQTNAYSATIGGGNGNTIQTNAACSTLGGGLYNTIQINALYATLGGGLYNTIQINALYATLGGGYDNTIQPYANYATLGGGSDNTIQVSALYATLGGGELNTIQDNAHYATIPGGQNNSAASYAFAAGRRAKANHTGAFVWGDSYNADIASTNANSVTMRASGGYRLFSNSGATVGVYLAAGSGTWTAMSDRNVKEAFQPVNPQAVLAKVAALPLTTWKYKAQDASVRHIGPMAQDFKAAFAVGESDTGITTIDADGVALAAIQGLNQKLEAQRAENTALKQRLEQLEQLVRQMTK
jgi:hypothetical protein